MASAPSTEQEAPPDPSAELSGEELDEGNKGPAGQKAKGESQVKSEEVDHPPEKDKIIDDKRQSSKENSSEIEKPVNITPDKCSTQSEELDEGNKGPAGQKAKGESQVKSEEVDHAPEKDKIIDDKRQSSKENSSEIEKPVNITPDKCSTQSAESDERNKGPAGQKAKGESQVKSEEVDHPPEKDKIIDDKRQSSKENSSEIEKPVNITPDKCSTQSAESDERNKGPAGQKAKGESQVKSEEVDHAPEKDKIIDDKRQSSKENPSEIEKPVNITPDKCSTQNLLTSPVSPRECLNEEKGKDVELIGPTATKTEPAGETGIPGGGINLLVGVAIVALVAIVAQCYLQSESQPQKTDWQQVDVFLKQMKNVKAKFPNQRTELWSRSEIHLKRHLQTSQPTEPVSLILTSGVRAERTMRCLAQGVASAFSAARNASVLHIDGAGKAGQDSDQVKLDIDRKLQAAFEGDKPVAVIHRLEELPPGSTLIFYRYCDHENAAYKKTFLIFTVLLGNEEEIPAEMRLSIVEEMVDDYLQKKFLSHGHPVSFDRMDLNKYGGLWSRISHLILPVAAEDRIEHEGC